MSDSRTKRTTSISAEVLYPGRGNAPWLIGDPELEEACCRVYNHWMIEFCSVGPGAFLRTGDDFVVEHRPRGQGTCAVSQGRAARGYHGLVPAEELPYSSDHYERFWAACQDLATPVNMHVDSGPGRAKF
jgi:hypothetical protein